MVTVLALFQALFRKNTAWQQQQQQQQQQQPRERQHMQQLPARHASDNNHSIWMIHDRSQCQPAQATHLNAGQTTHGGSDVSLFWLNEKAKGAFPDGAHHHDQSTSEVTMTTTSPTTMPSNSSRRWNVSAIHHHHTKPEAAATQLPTNQTSDKASSSNSSSNSNNDNNNKITLVVQLSGEMGNQIAKLASGLALAAWWRDDFAALSTTAAAKRAESGLMSHGNNDDPHHNPSSPLLIDLVLRHQEHPKWQSAMRHLLTCFPATRGLNFSQGNTPEIDQALLRQQRHGWQYSALQDQLNDPATSLDPERTRQVLHGISSQLLLSQGPLEACYSDHLDSSSNNHCRNYVPMRREQHLPLTTARRTSPPFLYISHLAGVDAWVDRYYEPLRQFFAMDTTHSCCCGSHHSSLSSSPSSPFTRPDPDETVLHIRNFIHEMPRRGRQRGYQELGPHQMATQLLGHLPPQAKVAIVTRFPNDDVVSQYVMALQQQQLRVRVISKSSTTNNNNSTDIHSTMTSSSSTTTTTTHDFCFLALAQGEIVGLARSTYFLWAALLGQATTVRAYSVDNTHINNNNNNNRSDNQHQQPMAQGGDVRYNWTHPILKRRFIFDVYRLEDD